MFNCLNAGLTQFFVKPSGKNNCWHCIFLKIADILNNVYFLFS